VPGGAPGDPSLARPPAARAHGPALTVFAGAASKPALEVLAAVYQSKTGTKVDVTYGGSGSVLTQFSQERYGDLYVPGSDDFMDKAEKKRAVIQSSRTVLVYLVPTICVARGNPKHVRDLRDFTRQDLRVVIGEPQSVCLGAIAQEVLTQTGLWEKTKPRVVSYASSCEEVLNTLVLGEADAVVGWDVFARQQSRKVQAIALPAKLARPRNIPAAVITWSKQPDKAKGFIKFLVSDTARCVFKEHGYTVEKTLPK